MITPSAVAADTMFRANAEHTGVFDDEKFIPIKLSYGGSKQEVTYIHPPPFRTVLFMSGVLTITCMQ